MPGDTRASVEAKWGQDPFNIAFEDIHVWAADTDSAAIDLIRPLEEAHNNLVRARLASRRLETGIVVGYDDLSGRISQAKLAQEEAALSFPELGRAIVDAELFLGRLPE